MSDLICRKCGWLIQDWNQALICYENGVAIGCFCRQCHHLKEKKQEDKND